MSESVCDVIKSESMKDSGVDWIGNIPVDWTVCRLKDLVSIENGKDYSDVYSEDGDIPVYGSGGSFAKATSYLYNEPSVLLGRKGTIDKPIFVDEPFWTIDTMYYTKMKEGICPKYLYHYATVFNYDYYRYGSAVPSMTQSDLYSIHLGIPDYNEQSKIAKYLDKYCLEISCYIDKVNHIIQKIQDYKQSLIFESVTKGLDKDVKLVDSGIDWIGKIPVDWTVCRLKDLVSIENGKDYSDVYSENGSIPVYGSGGSFAKATSCLYNEPSVLFGRKGTIDKPIFVDEPFWTIDTMYYTKMKEGIYPKYLYYYATVFNYDYYKGGSAVPSMTQSDLYSIHLAIPSIDCQKKIVDYLDRVCICIDSYQLLLNNLFTSLNNYIGSVIYECVTGKRKILEVY